MKNLRKRRNPRTKVKLKTASTVARRAREAKRAAIMRVDGTVGRETWNL